MIIDAFTGEITDTQKAMSEFGIKDIGEIVDSLEGDLLHPYLERGLMFGHTDAAKIFDAIKKKKSFAVMTGIKPTGQYHIGSLITCNEVLYFQSLGGKVYFCVADMESYLHSGTSLEEGHKTAIDNVADILALGLDHKNSYIYKQSEQKDVLKLAALFTKNITYNMIKAIYGEQAFGAYQSALIQAADILLPQLKQYEGPCLTVTPVGLEQAPHARLTRDLARKQLFREHYGFKMPSFTFHQILGSLDGGDKMSKSAGHSFMLTLSETPKSLKKKIVLVFTGGRETKQEQIEFGGRPDICRVFDLYRFFFMNKEDELKKRQMECKTGKILCGECKHDLFSRACKFIEMHQEAKESKFDLAKQILEE